MKFSLKIATITLIMNTLATAAFAGVPSAPVRPWADNLEISCFESLVDRDGPLTELTIAAADATGARKATLRSYANVFGRVSDTTKSLGEDFTCDLYYDRSESQPEHFVLTTTECVSNERGRNQKAPKKKIAIKIMNRSYHVTYGNSSIDGGVARKLGLYAMSCRLNAPN